MNLEQSTAWRPELPGWSRDILPFYTRLAKRIPHGGTFVEVGVFLGRSLTYMATIRPDLDIWAIDPWEDGANPPGYLGMGEFAHLNDKYGGLFPAFLGIMQEHAPDVLKRIHVVRARSTDIVLTNPADAVFIDGEHDYESVRADIRHWEEQIKLDGILCGHDCQPDYPGVKRALEDAELKYVVDTIDDDTWSSCWSVVI